MVDFNDFSYRATAKFSDFGDGHISTKGAKSESSNSTYAMRAPQYQFDHETYTGGKAFANKHLEKHPREVPTDYEERKVRSYYLNYGAPIVRAKNAAIYQKGIKRTLIGGSDADQLAFLASLKSVDSHGTSASSFFKAINLRTQVFGTMPIRVHPPGVAATNLAEAQANAATFEGMDPRFMTNWSYGPDGNFDFVVFSFSKILRTADGDETLAEVKEVWGRTSIATYDAEGTKTKEIPHGMSKTPVVLSFNSDHQGDTVSDSELKDISFLSKAILNKCSLLDEIHYRQTFSQAVIEGVRAGDADNIAMSPGTGNVLLIPEGATFKYAGPDPANAAALETAIANLGGQIRTMALTDRRTNEAQRIGSGNALAIKHRDLNADLSDKASNMEDAEERCFALRNELMFSNASDLRVAVEYSRDYDTLSVTDEIDLALAALALPAGAKFKESVLKRTARRVLPREDEKDQKEIDKQIEIESKKAPEPALRDDDGGMLL